MNDSSGPPLVRQQKDAYGPDLKEHILEQYKLYVEMADRISARRMLSNSFFVSIHTALLAALALLFKEEILAKSGMSLIPFGAAVIMCFVWWRIIRSYRQLNSHKFEIIHKLEQLLPTCPYQAEWIALGEGKNPKLYTPMTHVENWVPLCYGALYIMLAGAILFQTKLFASCPI